MSVISMLKSSVLDVLQKISRTVSPGTDCVCQNGHTTKKTNKPRRNPASKRYTTCSGWGHVAESCHIVRRDVTKKLWAKNLQRHSRHSETRCVVTVLAKVLVAVPRGASFQQSLSCLLGALSQQSHPPVAWSVVSAVPLLLS